jgi:hypothetical protein
MKNTIAICICMAGLFFAACSDKEGEDKVKQIDQSAAIETAIEVNHVDSIHDVITTTYKVWLKDSNTKTIVHHDSIGYLGTHEVTLEQENGEEVNKTVPKDYEIFITVK